MKKIEIRPEWILEQCPHTVHPDGKGNIMICTDSLSLSIWIDLALDTLDIEYESSTIGYDPDPEKQCFEVRWEFRIEDIKEECPAIYDEWMQLNERNAQYLYGVKPQYGDIEETAKIQKS